MIQVKKLSYAYPGQTENTLEELSFDINAGEIFGFLGPSGSGKSTTQKLLIGLLKGHQGSAEIFNREINQWGSDLYHRIGVGFELPNHYSKLTAHENLMLFASLYGLNRNQAQSRVSQLLEETGLTDAANQRTNEFSKGMKMRLNFARALLPDPELLFLDEPTSGLDPVNAANIRSMILALKAQGKTVFLTTHNMHDAEQLCDRIAFIVEGQIKNIDSPRKLKQAFGERTVVLEQRSQEDALVLNSYPLEGLAINEAFQTQLQKFPVETLHSKEASLEDVFIKLTGAQLT